MPVFRHGGYAMTSVARNHEFFCANFTLYTGPELLR